MPSKAREKFNESAQDINTLIELYDGVVELFKDDQDPIPEGLEVLFRSAVVLMVSNWEAYVEDICSEAVEHLVLHLPDASKLPKDIKKKIADEVKGKDHELEMWKLADSGWKDYLKSRLIELKAARDRSFMTPKAQNTADFLTKALGLDDVRTSWSKSDITSSEVANKLDALIEVRGQIAHRGRISQKIDQTWVAEHVELLSHIVSRTGGAINKQLTKVTGKPLWDPKKATVIAATI